MKKIILFFLITYPVYSQNFNPKEIAKWEQQAKNITIIRDQWGIPHIYGKTDADAVFGLLYAQCEDDFNRVEMNYVEKLGRMAEINGEKDLYNDLLNRLVIDSIDAKNDYKKAPVWLKKILNAYADGINFYLYKNPKTKPTLLKKFQPWYPLLWTDGSIGAISTAGITVHELKNLYSNQEESPIAPINFEEEKYHGSNGFAFSPKITASGNAILYLNPHVTFYFRPEVHMISDEGLNAYGAVTWGQPFIYQGFNEYCGWMHTSSQADISDAYIEKLIKKNKQWFYEYEGKLLSITQKSITIKYKQNNRLLTKTFKTLFTHHGPIMAKRDGNYLSLRHNNRDLNGFIQSWLRTKAKSFADFKKTMDMGANPSNNTVYADAEGNIAYWHGNFLPKRNPNFDWSKPVDGTLKATEWQGYHPVSESVHIYNPQNGWLQNCNSTPFTVAGNFSPKKSDYPAYLAPDGENFRGLNAVRVLNEEKQYTLDNVIKAGYDTRLTAFEILIPALIKAFETKRAENKNQYSELIEPIQLLQQWDFKSAENSIATTLAVEWGEKIMPSIQKTQVLTGEENSIVQKTIQYTKTVKPEDFLNPLVDVLHDLQKRYGNWQIEWGAINRIQRIAADIENRFDDHQMSYPVGFVSSTWGMLPSFNSKSFQTKKRYGYSGNSFVAAVEFGKKINAKSLLAGGQNNNPESPNFFDQGLMYSKGQFKEVLFYKDDVIKNAVKTYHPGE